MLFPVENIIVTGKPESSLRPLNVIVFIETPPLMLPCLGWLFKQIAASGTISIPIDESVWSMQFVPCSDRCAAGSYPDDCQDR